MRYGNIEKIIRELLIKTLEKDQETLELALKLFNAYLKEGKSKLQEELKNFILKG